MKKYISLIIGTFIIIALMIQIVYATNSEILINNKLNQEEKFFRTDVTQISSGDIVTMTIDLSKINYDDFKFTLSSNIDISNIVTDSNSNSENQTQITINENNNDNNEIIIISNKSNIDMKKIELYFKIPDNLSVGTTITLNAKICEYTQNTSNNEDILTNSTSNNNVILNETTNNTLVNNIINNNNNNQNVQEVSITLKVVDKSNIENQNENNNNLQNNINNNTSSMTFGSSKTSQSGSTAVAVTYNGSYDNYLTSLTIDGYNLTPEFTKTTDTYFITVANEVNSINARYIKSDDNAKVQIYGNDALKEGENKVLISVTAENGNVRTYRIYVTREA